MIYGIKKSKKNVTDLQEHAFKVYPKREGKNETYSIKKVGNKYMIFDNNIGEFLIGYSFNSEVEANKFKEKL